MEKQLTEKENEFLVHLKKALFLKGYTYRFKVPLKELCDSRKDLDIIFGKDENLISTIEIDIVIAKKNQVIAGIEIIDEPEEINNLNGEKMLKEFLFARMGYIYFRISDLEHFEDAAKNIRDKLKEK